MDRSSKLIPSNLIEQCNAAILMLAQDNDRLTSVAQSIDTFVNDTSIKSTAFDALKNQMANFDAAISLMMMANDADIEAYTILSGMVGSEELDGEVLFDQLEEAERSKKEAESKVEHYSSLALTVPGCETLTTYNSTTLMNYNKLIHASEEIIKKIKEKMELYDEIESKSKGLFETGENLRNTATSVVQEITSSGFSGGNYITADASGVHAAIDSKLGALGLGTVAMGATTKDSPFSTKSDTWVSTFKESEKVEMDFKKKKAYFKYKSEYRFSSIYDEVKYEGEHSSGSLKSSFGKIDVDTQAKAVFWNDKSMIEPQLEGEIKAEGSIYEARADYKVGTDNVYSKTELEGDIGAITAKGKLGFSKDEDGKGYDVGGSIDLDASVFSGEVKQKFNVFGYELELSAEGKALGAGFEAKAEYDSGMFDFKVGATAGVGGSVGIKFGKAMPEMEEPVVIP
ncbi:MAG: hypothetical protein E7262_03565 [Lachnospiraceae bacterium]|nr:hypothetical protein [Lachnospiraceae bacterium]